MKNLWNDKEAKSFGVDFLNQRVYSSRLLGRNPDLVLHGGGNTSVKGSYKNIFGNKIETLFVKGSGWDLISIEKDGFAPVDLKYLLSLAQLDELSDTDMVIQQKIATLKPNSPSPSLNSPPILISLKVVKPVIFAPDVIFKFFTSTSANTDLLRKFAVPFTSNFVFFDMSIPSPPKNVLLKKVTLA